MTPTLIRSLAPIVRPDDFSADLPANAASAAPRASPEALTDFKKSLRLDSDMDTPFPITGGRSIISSRADRWHGAWRPAGAEGRAAPCYSDLTLSYGPHPHSSRPGRQQDRGGRGSGTAGFGGQGAARKLARRRIY